MFYTVPLYLVQRVSQVLQSTLLIYLHKKDVLSNKRIQLLEIFLTRTSYNYTDIYTTYYYNVVSSADHYTCETSYELEVNRNWIL